MKKLEIIIKTDSVDCICRSLLEAGAAEVFVSETKGIDDESPLKQIYRGRVYEVDFMPKAKLEVIVPDSLVVPVVSAIVEGSSNERKGNGHIFISSIEKAIEINSYDLDSEVLQWLH